MRTIGPGSYHVGGKTGTTVVSIPIGYALDSTLRVAAARIHEDLLTATKAAPDAVTPQDAAGRYAACGSRLAEMEAS